MMAAGRQKLAQASTYECSRCGDEYPLAGGDDELLVMIHRLLHLAADWRFGLAAGGRVGPQTGGGVGTGGRGRRGGGRGARGGGRNLDVLGRRQLLDAGGGGRGVVER